MLSKAALVDALERAARTFAQVFLAMYAPVVLGAGSLGGLLDLSVADKASAAGVAAVFSVVMSALGSKLGSSPDDGSLR